MAQAASITINDGQATPVAVTFAPESVTPQQSSFADRTGGVALGFRRLGISNTFASGKSTVNKAVFTTAIPVLQTVNGVTTLVRTLRAKTEYILPDGSTDAERKDLHAFHKNGMAHALIQGAMRDLDPLY